MNYLKTPICITKLICLALVSLLSSCGENSQLEATQPTLDDYTIGETWTWKYKGVTTEGEVRSEGEDTREIINTDGVLGITVGNDTIPLSDIVKPEKSETPRYKWPLKVGETWKY